jgi:quinol-cytochrome oxidoreductase complex cytochrome b subunit
MKERKGYPLYPDFTLNLLILALLVLGILLTLAVILAPTIQKEADPLTPLVEVKPQWYLFWLYQIFNYLNPGWGGLLVLVFIVLLFLLPFIDRGERRPRRRRLISFGLGLIVIGLLIFLSVVGYLGGGGG